jgi:hypothetical protein
MEDVVQQEWNWLGFDFKCVGGQAPAKTVMYSFIMDMA